MDDETLAAALATDLDGAFETLVRIHQDRLYTLALRLLGDRRDAEEITQDALVRAYRALTSYDAERIEALRLRSWLATIVVNLSRNRATRRRPPRTVSLDGNGSDAGASLPASRADELPHDALVRRDAVRHWEALLADLPTRYRLPVVLRHVDGLSVAETAEVLGRAEGTVKVQVHRGLALLRAAHEAIERNERRGREEMTA
jgi:RNA polymerase sigma factor (sigma-70 family)